MSDAQDEASKIEAREEKYEKIKSIHISKQSHLNIQNR
jgi:hypothetical protein